MFIQEVTPLDVVFYSSRRPSMARAIVTSSAYSMSLPAGTPVAMRVILTRKPRRALASQVAVASPSSVGLVARITSSTSPRSTRGKQRAGPQLVGTHAMQGREGAVEHVVNPHVAASPLDRGDVGGFLHHANLALIAGRVGAIGAGVDVGHVVADRAKAQADLQAAHGLSQRRGVVVGGAQDVKGEALGAFGAHARQLLQLFNEPGHGLGIS